MINRFWSMNGWMMWRTLSSLKLHGNNFSSPISEIALRGLSALKEFLRNRESVSAPSSADPGIMHKIQTGLFLHVCLTFSPLFHFDSWISSRSLPAWLHEQTTSLRLIHRLWLCPQTNPSYSVRFPPPSFISWSWSHFLPKDHWRVFAFVPTRLRPFSPSDHAKTSLSRTFLFVSLLFVVLWIIWIWSNFTTHTGISHQTPLLWVGCLRKKWELPVHHQGQALHHQNAHPLWKQVPPHFLPPVLRSEFFLSFFHSLTSILFISHRNPRSNRKLKKKKSTSEITPHLCSHASLECTAWSME